MTATARPLALSRMLSQQQLLEHLKERRIPADRTTIWRYRNRARNPLPCVRLAEGPCARVLFDPLEVDRWFERCRVNTVAKASARRKAKAAGGQR
jgi:hypothetical protein